MKTQSNPVLKYRQHRIKTEHCKIIDAKDLLVNVETPNSRIDFYCTEDMSSHKEFTSMTSDRKDKKKTVVQYDDIKHSYNTVNPKEDSKKCTKKKPLFIPKKNLVKHYKTQCVSPDQRHHCKGRHISVEIL